ncbi:hypothetical protein, partial [Caulobacter sp. 17J65-9]|uniref:hypothetical protein n=1 Tax=Caulobacter sp. 17J65-9 TaxID=2709382 RepID=UPI0013C6356D
MTFKNVLTLGAALALAGGLAACGERKEKAETGTSEAEVSTTAPTSQVSDQQLEAAAAQAAADASATTPAAPPATTTTTPPPANGAT